MPAPPRLTQNQTGRVMALIQAIPKETAQVEKPVAIPTEVKFEV
jgi:hypothetical protein